MRPLPNTVTVLMLVAAAAAEDIARTALYCDMMLILTLALKLGYVSDIVDSGSDHMELVSQGRL